MLRMVVLLLNEVASYHDGAGRWPWFILWDKVLGFTSSEKNASCLSCACNPLSWELRAQV